MKRIISDNPCKSVVQFFLSGNFVAELSLLFLITSTSFSQTETQSPSFGDSISELVSFFAPLIPFKIAHDTYELKEFIRGDEFSCFRAERGDLNAVDSIFSAALQLSWNNVYEALLISTIATMDHSKFGVKLPIVGPLVWVPLTSEFEEDFQKRVAALPRMLYVDSPIKHAGDRDKLQHFFGSAFLAYVFESRDAAERIGGFVEWGEDKVVVDGALDERDFRANRHGQEFGLALRNDKSVNPSSYIMYTLAQEHSRSDTIQVK
jgi:hypothetical protein